MTEEELEPRKKCGTCSRYLIAFQGHYMHVNETCTGIQDYIHFDAFYADFQANQKFVEIYGKPDHDDYDRLEILEKTLEDTNKRLQCADELNKELEKKFNKPLFRFFIKFLSFLKSGKKDTPSPLT